VGALLELLDEAALTHGVGGFPARGAMELATDKALHRGCICPLRASDCCRQPPNLLGQPPFALS
jgi:hypothetical protein